MQNTKSLFGVPLRDSFVDFQHVESDLVEAGVDYPEPLVTIGIPTYKRSDLLFEAVQSVLAQHFDRPVEIVVVDNDPSSKCVVELVARLPELKRRNFRYFVNRENIGGYPNWNRCISLGRGQWISVLNDDDILFSNYLELMFSVLDRNPKIDGITSRKKYFQSSARKSRDVVSAQSNFFIRLWDRIEHELVYRGRASRTVKAREFFWGAVLGNGGGFMFRKETALQIGGYYPEDEPSADFWFYARFAKLACLHEHRDIAAAIRKGDTNGSLSSFMEQLAFGYRLQHAMTGREVPRWWRSFLPYMVEHYRGDFKREWDVHLSAAEVEKRLKIRLKSSNMKLLNFVKRSARLF